MEIVSDMIIKFTADDISDMLFEKMRKNIPDIDIHQYEYEIITPFKWHCDTLQTSQQKSRRMMWNER